MGKKRRGHPDVEDLLARSWCYYCEREFEDLKLLISHQKAKHFKCDRCGRRLNTAGGLSVHLNQVHKETLNQVDNALPNRGTVDVEIFGMEGIPQEALEQHRNRIIQTFYQAQETRRVETGNPLPGQSMQNSRKKLKVETPEELVKRLAEYRVLKKTLAAGGGAMDGVVATGAGGQNAPMQQPQQQQQQPQGYPGHQQPGQPYGYPTDSLPARPTSGLTNPTGLPQRPTQGSFSNGPGPMDGQVQGAAPGDDIDQLIRMAEAGIRPPQKGDDGADEAGAEKKGKKEKKAKMVYEDAEVSPEERMAALPRYAFRPEVAA